jgi:hypothetical protein
MRCCCCVDKASKSRASFDTRDRIYRKTTAATVTGKGQRNTRYLEMTKESSEKASKAKQPEEDDDSENDDDYVPDEMDVDLDDDDDAEPATSETFDSNTPHLSASKRKAVDEAFEKLFGYPFGTRFAVKRRRDSRPDTVISHREEILRNIFGPSVAAELLATSSTVRANNEGKRITLPTTIEQTITETMRFAGRNITMTKKVMVDAKTAGDDIPAKPPVVTASAATTTKTTGLDSVLAEISGPSKLSTVAKTSADWDVYKEKTGVDEELEKQAQGNKAFLVKQDFLKRVDERRFEHEKAQRDRQRTSRK